MRSQHQNHRHNKMKKITLSCLAVVLLPAYTLLAQNTFNFESWTGNEPDGWVSSNELTTSNGGAQTVFKETTSPGQGSFSVKMVTGNCPDCPNFNVFGIPTPLPSPYGGDIEYTTAYTQRPISVDFKYKSSPVGNDVCGFNVQLTKYDALNDEDVVIGEGWFESSNTVTTWTNMNVPIVYYSNDVIDKISIWATSSIGSLPDLSALGVPPYPFVIPTPVAGSTFYVDAIHINLPSCDGLNVSVSGTNTSSLLAMDGTATATPSGGTAPYSYAWSNFETTQSISSLLPGLYSVTITDANGCAKVGTYNVLPTSCGAFSVSVTGTQASSFTAEDGSATATVSGGTPPYTYLWNTGDETASISGLRLGGYSVAVTDATGNCVAFGYFPNSAPTGINNISSTTNLFNLFPNPSNGTFSIASDNKVSHIEVVNMLGELVYTSQTGGTVSAIELSNQPNGLYFVHITHEKGKSIEKLVLKK